jgi:hypothetical protein
VGAVDANEGGGRMSQDVDAVDELRDAVVAAARRWYRSTNEAELASAVQELEIELKRRAA